MYANFMLMKFRNETKLYPVHNCGSTIIIFIAIHAYAFLFFNSKVVVRSFQTTSSFLCFNLSLRSFFLFLFISFCSDAESVTFGVMTLSCFKIFAHCLRFEWLLGNWRIGAISIKSFDGVSPEESSICVFEALATSSISLVSLQFSSICSLSVLEVWLSMAFVFVTFPLTLLENKKNSYCHLQKRIRQYPVPQKLRRYLLWLLRSIRNHKKVIRNCIFVENEVEWINASRRETRNPIFFRGCLSPCITDELPHNTGDVFVFIRNHPILCLLFIISF